MERTFIFTLERENWNFWDTDEERRPRRFNTYMSYWRQEKSGRVTAVNLLKEFEWMNSRSKTNKDDKESEREKDNRQLWRVMIIHLLKAYST